MERFTVGSEGLDLIFNQHFRRSSWASLSPKSTGQHRGLGKEGEGDDSHSAQASAKGGVEQSATEGNTPTADEGENKGLERQKTFTDGGTRQRETELEIAQTEKDTIGGEQGR
ncbi:hypothetical protein DPX16_7298 [Anabarilius grahami]|uniref:Uncharacterized protein n=1 Tax=Anabarilius grahami TaxID=495550 RepID=A0A3N0Z2N9_ANAGA|nr:hypothetical protein DPX16_7298 [Anabarilius grahami]